MARAINRHAVGFVMIQRGKDSCLRGRATRCALPPRWTKPGAHGVTRPTSGADKLRPAIREGQAWSHVAFCRSFFVRAEKRAG